MIRQFLAFVFQLLFVNGNFGDILLWGDVLFRMRDDHRLITFGIFFDPSPVPEGEEEDDELQDHDDQGRDEKEMFHPFGIRDAEGQNQKNDRIG